MNSDPHNPASGDDVPNRVRRSLPGIPKRIIQIYCAPPGQPSELPLTCQASLANCRLLHPDFEHILFGSSEMDAFIAKEFPEYRSIIDSFPFRIQRFDFFRYLAIYKLGGFYFDLDIFLAKRLDPLLEFSCVFPFEELSISDYLREEHGMDWEIANYGFGAAPGNPFIGSIITNCVRAVHDNPWKDQMLRGIPRWFQSPFYVPVTTGPGMASRTLAENPELAKDVTILFPNDVCDERYWQKFGDYGVHLMQGSWRQRDGFIRSKLRRLWETRKRKLQLAQSRKNGPRRSSPRSQPSPASAAKL